MLLAAFLKYLQNKISPFLISISRSVIFWVCVLQQLSSNPTRDFLQGYITVTVMTTGESWRISSETKPWWNLR